MPTYEYHCSKCEKQFEVVQSIKDKPLTTCPKSACRQKTWGKGKVKKMIGAGAGLIFKGSGFYITDYRSDKYKEAAKKDSTAPSTASSGGESKSSGGTESKATTPKTETKKSKAKE